MTVHLKNRKEELLKKHDFNKRENINLRKKIIANKSPIKIYDVENAPRIILRGKNID